MPLDLSRVSIALSALTLPESTNSFQEQIGTLRTTFRSVSTSDLSVRIHEARTSWLLAMNQTHFNQIISRPDPELLREYTVIATDGSFIAPERYMRVPFCLFNTAVASFEYGRDASSASLTAEPLLLSGDDLYVSNIIKRVPLQGAVLGMLRHILETEAFLPTVKSREERSQLRLGLMDGTLIPWSLESQPDFVVKWALDRLIPTMDQLRDAGFPIASFISYPASRDVINSLRVSVCDYPDKGLAVNCDHCRGRIESEQHTPACDRLPDVEDRVLFSHAASLARGERTATFLSSSSILKKLGDHAVSFFYLNCGDEIARVEVPGWVAEDVDALTLVHAAVLDQCEKGRGYPVVLQEAHERAVITQADRSTVEQMLEQHLSDHGMVAHATGKQASKRSRFI